MCDTLVALAGATRSGRVVMAKNSDRERNEAQFLEQIGRREHSAEAEIRLTYLTIPQVRHTHAVLLSRPCWGWGAEMGANEHGVVIGNEAMHATIPAQRRRALTGMDLVRLALERAEDAESAAEVIITLLERYGQGGNCGHLNRFYYNNGFLIADARRAFVLETVGRWWALEEVKDMRALSNAYSIGAGYDRISATLQTHAERSGWAAPGGRFDLAATLTDTERDAATWGRGRCARGTVLLERERGVHDVASMQAILRDHGPEAETDPGWSPDRTVGRTICMHATDGGRRGQTTGSLVSDLAPDAPAVHWVTGRAAPCTALFRPVVLGAALPVAEPQPTDRFDPATMWWRHELLHRAVLSDFAPRLARIAPDRDAIEARFREAMADAMQRTPDDMAALSRVIAACWNEAAAAEAGWLAQMRGAAANGPIRSPGRSWTRLNRRAGLPG